jgi:hypothetical protein
LWIFYFFIDKKENNKILWADANDVHRTEICCFLCTTAKDFRHNPHCRVTIIATLFYNFRERIAMVLVEKLRAGIPACPTTDAAHPINGYNHPQIP